MTPPGDRLKTLNVSAFRLDQESTILGLISHFFYTPITTSVQLYGKKIMCFEHICRDLWVNNHSLKLGKLQFNLLIS